MRLLVVSWESFESRHKTAASIIYSFVKLLLATIAQERRLRNYCTANIDLQLT